MKNALNTIIAFFIFIMIILVSGAVYVVDETKQVVVTQFGEPIGEPITEAGLYFKIPFIQTANYFEKRILRWDGDANQIPTRDKRYILVDTTARWKIVDALKFMQSVGSEASAQSRLDDVIDAATRDAVSNLNLIESVRNSNVIIDRSKDKRNLEDVSDIANVTFEKINVGREKLTRDILRRSSQIVPNYGIELIDVRVKRINYIKTVRLKVYDRMISERKRAAEKFRSEGQGKKAEIEGQMTKELEKIQSEAYKTAQELKGEADAEAIDIYAEAYNNDPEFYSFTQTLETYRNTIDADNTLILTTETEFFKYLKDISRGGE